MGLILFSLALTILLSLATPQPDHHQNQPHLLDLAIRDYTFRSYTTNSIKTGQLHTINLPSNLSTINVSTIRLRCGSLQRHGAKINEFHLSTGLNIHPCTERVILIRQNLGSNWSSIYYNTYGLSGYQLVSPLLGLLAYNSADTADQIEIKAGKNPIVIDFNNVIPANANASSGISPLCASFDLDGKATLFNQERPNLCFAKGRIGHFGLVVESPLMEMTGNKESKWKIVTVSAIGGALGACLLSLLMIAMCVNAKKKKEKMDELERRAYEEEALQVSMVGHVRAVAASGTRTVPTIEHYESYKQPHS